MSPVRQFSFPDDSLFCHFYNVLLGFMAPRGRSYPGCDQYEVGVALVFAIGIAPPDRTIFTQACPLEF